MQMWRAYQGFVRNREGYLALLLDLAGQNHLSGLCDSARNHNPQTSISGPVPGGAG